MCKWVGRWGIKRTLINNIITTVFNAFCPIRIVLGPCILAIYSAAGCRVANVRKKGVKLLYNKYEEM